MTANTPNDLTPPGNGPASTTPIDVGDVIATGWRLYTKNFSQYWPVSLKANLWMFVPLVLVALITMLFPLAAQRPEDYLGFLALLVPAFIVVGLICLAQFLGWSTGISRMAYQSLSGTSETERESLRFTRSRKYSLLWQAILKGLIFFAAYIVSVIILTILMVIVAIATGGFGSADVAAGVPAAIGVMTVIGVLAFLWFFIWLALRMMIAEQPLAIEQDSGAAKAIGRSWNLIKGSALRSFLVAIVTYLITVPIALVIYVIFQLIAYRVLTLAPPAAAGDTIATFADLLPFLGGIAIGAVGSVVGNVVTIPLWHTTLTALYHALRQRKEGVLTPLVARDAIADS
ncbi:MAG: hypothetical protein AAFV90_04620 [Cyanobacteria bacterium J06634_5]